ncbi:MAG: hypothetical protein ACK5JH_03055 [Anaerocolumna sp.]
MATKNIDEKSVAKKVILNSLRIEDCLTNLLKIETRFLKNKSDQDFNYDEIKKIDKSIKYLLYYLIIIDDRIQKCLDIIQNKNEEI